MSKNIENRKRRNRLIIDRAKYGKECVRCGQDHPATLDFHHRDPSVKSFNISTARNGRISKYALMTELKKCDVLCSNCHRIEHYNEEDKLRMRLGRSPCQRVKKFVQSAVGQLVLRLELALNAVLDLFSSSKGEVKTQEPNERQTGENLNQEIEYE